MPSALKSAKGNASSPEPPLRLQSGLVSFLDLISEQGAEGLQHSFRGSALHHVPDLVGEANGDELLQGGHAAQHHVANQPFYLMIKALWQDPVSDEARLLRRRVSS